MAEIAAYLLKGNQPGWLGMILSEVELSVVRKIYGLARVSEKLKL